MWGAEMGANEHGVVIGNEAVFTKVKIEKKNNGLTGMDLLRLALERSKTAGEALTCITSLLEQYGQDACGGYKNKSFFYHNSFIIADASEAWVLETAGRAWAAEKVKDIRSISNKLSIDNADLLSNDARALAKQKGWWKEGDAFSFQNAYSDWFYTKMGRAAARQTCTTSLSLKQKGELTPAHAMHILQTHNIEGESFKPSKANTGSVCMHATSILNPSNTTGSMVAEVRSHAPATIWLTGTAHPCLSVYIPFYVNTNVLQDFLQPSAKRDQSLWWKAEQLHRWINKDYQKRKTFIEPDRQALQKEFLEREATLFQGTPSMDALAQFSNECLSSAQTMIEKWRKLI
jgi:dipeptidase